MVDAGIYSTKALVDMKTGFGVSTVSSAQAYIDEYLFEAESYINVLTKKVWATTAALFASSLDVGIRGLLTEAASNLAAIYVIQYDTRGYPSSRAAETIINILWARFENCIHLLNDVAATDFMKTT